MKTVSSLAASGSVTALSALGLALARREHVQQRPRTTGTGTPSNTSSTTPEVDMTAVASYPLSTPLAEPYTFPTSQPRRFASDGDSNNYGRAHARRASAAKKRHSLTPSTSFSMGMDRSLRPEGEQRGGGQPRSSSAQQQQQPNNSTWLRRLSSSVSTSRDSSRTPTSRPGSAAYTNGSVTVSHTSSSTPIFADSTPPSLPPNKLVKRSSSVRSTNGSPSQGSGSRLPIPTFRRPATSHQRSATLRERFSGSDRSGRMSLDGSTQDARDSSWRHYFTPRIAAEEVSSSKRSSSTGIPNPIKRVYPDRKYTPILVSAHELVKPSTVELDDGLSDHEDSAAAANIPMAPSTASSPLPTHIAHFEESTSPRRSFSIGDLLSTGPQQLWRRTSSSKSRPRSSRASRKGRPRVASEPHAPMGNTFSGIMGHESERPAKRRDLTNPKASQRSIFSSSSSSNAVQPETRQEIDINLATESPYVEFTPDHSLFVEPTFRAQTPSEQHHLPSATLFSSSAKLVRLSAAQSEIASTIGSDSEYRSAGDNSTDYQSDTMYDSIPTRTTRSSSGRRGPHIETIFDESPPTFSSGRSTKLKDFLSDGHFPGGEHNGYRHSTIEEEGSMVSTPVRSMHNKSITSTPSARPGAPQVFPSSPPAMNIMPDPDEIDWDAMEDDKSDRGLGIRTHSSTPSINGTPTDRSLPFRFGPALRPGNSHPPNSTPQRNGASPMDRTNLFDWAEAQPSPSHPNNSPPRPRTVHGKKDQDSRGSRPTGRRPPSGMHVRSHSVPVVPDLDGKRNNVVANKFGTWGVGSKAVTEDWNEDFDFDEPSLPVYSIAEQDEKRIDSGHEMLVPKSIREQQENVVANISLLREWGLLIEELKELRIRAVALDMMNGQHAQAWREVDAMIELADQETEEQTLEPRRSPPSSPGFDYSAFEDTPASNKTSKIRPRESSIKFAESDLAMPDISPRTIRTNVPHNTPLTGRPRKDSELVAQNVIAALQSKRSVSDQSAMHAVAPKKVPFDTATLRHIVPYVNGLKRKVKDALRETEGLYSSPRRRLSPNSSRRREHHGEEPAFRTMFNELPDDDLTIHSRRERAATDHDGADSPLFNGSESLSNRMQKMSFPS